MAEAEASAVRAAIAIQPPPEDTRRTKSKGHTQTQTAAEMVFTLDRSARSRRGFVSFATKYEIETNLLIGGLGLLRAQPNVLGTQLASNLITNSINKFK